MLSGSGCQNIKFEKWTSNIELRAFDTSYLKLFVQLLVQFQRNPKQLKRENKTQTRLSGRFKSATLNLHLGAWWTREALKLQFALQGQRRAVHLSCRGWTHTTHTAGPGPSSTNVTRLDWTSHGSSPQITELRLRQATSGNQSREGMFCPPVTFTGPIKNSEATFTFLSNKADFQNQIGTPCKAQVKPSMCLEAVKMN